MTFTEFDVDPGVDVDVYLVPGDGSDVSDRVELGNLKGNVGDQQYEIPADADLNRYSTVVLWCKPFTVRIAVAELDVLNPWPSAFTPSSSLAVNLAAGVRGQMIRSIREERR